MQEFRLPPAQRSLSEAAFTVTVLVLQELFPVLISPVAAATEHVPPLFGFCSVPVAVGVTGMVTTAELPLLIVSPLPPAVQVSTWVPLSIEHVSAFPALSVGEPYVAPVVGNWSVSTVAPAAHVAFEFAAAIVTVQLKAVPWFTGLALAALVTVTSAGNGSVYETRTCM